jgi:hypothetical protein
MCAWNLIIQRKDAKKWSKIPIIPLGVPLILVDSSPLIMQLCLRSCPLTLALNTGALQVVNWEYSEKGEKSCAVFEALPITKCEQGRIPLYSARVHSSDDIVAVLRFAAIHNVRITIRNTGHDLAGRSTAPGSLQIDTRGLKSIQYTDSFHPRTPLGQGTGPEEPAVTIGAGVLTGELYAAAAQQGYTVVGGSCSTVGIAGGWMQGGGYGILSPSRGLGSDNVLELSLVTAEVRSCGSSAHCHNSFRWSQG